MFLHYILSPYLILIFYFLTTILLVFCSLLKVSNTQILFFISCLTHPSVENKLFSFLKKLPIKFYSLSNYQT